MNWTTERPTHGGLWWAYQLGIGVIPVDLYKKDGRWIVFELGDNYDVEFGVEDYTHWMEVLVPMPPEDSNEA